MDSRYVTLTPIVDCIPVVARPLGAGVPITGLVGVSGVTLKSE